MKPRIKNIIDGSTYSSFSEEGKEGFEFCGRYNKDYMLRFNNELSLDGRFPKKHKGGDEAKLEEIADPLFTNGFGDLLKITGKKDLDEIDDDIYCKTENEELKIGNIDTMTILCGDVKYKSLSEEEKEKWEHVLTFQWKDIRQACDYKDCIWNDWFNPMFRSYSDIGYLGHEDYDEELEGTSTNIYRKEMNNVSFEKRFKFWIEMISTKQSRIRVFDKGLGKGAFLFEPFYFHNDFLNRKINHMR